MSSGSASTGGQDVLVVGGGHNGLVAAVRLARAGCRVTVLEQGAEAGGCVWTERHASGVLVERGAFEHGGVLPVVRELGLDDPALGQDAVQYKEHPVVAGFLFGDGTRRVFYTNLERTIAGLGKDGPAYRRLVELADALFGMLHVFDSPPTLTQVAAALDTLPGGDRLFRTMLQPAETVIDAALDDPYARAALALQAAHAQVPAWSPGTGLFGLLLPSSHGGSAVRPDGGSRALTDALVAALETAGGTVRTESAVVRMGTSTRPRTVGAVPRRRPSAAAHAPTNGPVGVFGGGLGAQAVVPAVADPFDWSDGAEVELADGTVLSADAVVSTLGLPRTATLVADPAPRMREAAGDLHSGHFNVSELTVTLVGGKPFALPLEDPDAVWYAVADPADVRTGFGDVLAGRLPTSPWAMVAEVRQPDDVEGGALWLSSIVPLRRADGPWTTELEREAGERLVDHVAQVLGVDLRANLVDLVVSGPPTWADRTGGDGSPNHLDNTIDQLLGWRPPGHADLRTELPWLFLAGAGQHPGGGLNGTSGSAAAAAVLTRVGRRASVARRLADEVQGLRRGLAAYRAMRRGNPR